MASCNQWEDVYGWITSNAPDWNGSAVYYEPLSSDGYYFFQIAESAVGIVVGLTSDYSSPDYFNIAHGLYFHHGEFSVIESGVKLTTDAKFKKTDTFVLARNGGNILYGRSETGDVEDAVFFLTTTHSPDETLFLDTSFYAVGDTILSVGHGSNLSLVRVGDSIAGSFSFGGTGTTDGYTRLVCPMDFSGAALSYEKASATGSFSLRCRMAEHPYTAVDGTMSFGGSASSVPSVSLVCKIKFTGLASGYQDTASVGVARGSFTLSGSAHSSAPQRLNPTFSFTGLAVGHKVERVEIARASGSFSFSGRAYQGLLLEEYTPLTGYFIISGRAISHKSTATCSGNIVFGGVAGDVPFTASRGAFRLSGIASGSHASMSNYFTVLLKFAEAPAPKFVATFASSRSHFVGAAKAFTGGVVEAFAVAGFDISSRVTSTPTYRIVERLKLKSKITHQMQLHPTAKSYFVARDRIFRIVNSMFADGVAFSTVASAATSAKARIRELIQLQAQYPTGMMLVSPFIQDEVLLSDMTPCMFPAVITEELELFDEVLYLYEMYAAIQEHFGAMSSSIGTP